MTHLFISILKEVAFEWFMKLPTDFIKKWVNLEKLFLVRFFEDDSEVSVPTLCYKEKERRVNQSVCKEILEYDTSMSKWHDAVYIGGDLLP